MTIVSICTDMTALKATGAVDADSPYRGMLDGRSGGHVHRNGNTSMIILSSKDGLEILEQLPFVTVTDYETNFGYTQQLVIDDVPQFGKPIKTVTPGYFKQVVTRYTDGDPIYLVERIVTPTTREVTDEEGVTTTVAGRDVITYETTEEIDGYYQVPVYGAGDYVEEQTTYTPNPIMEEVPGDPDMLALYQSIYDYTPYVDDEGNTVTPSQFFVTFGDDTVAHIL